MSDYSLTVLAPAMYSDPEWSTRYLRRSASRVGLDIRWYAVGLPYTNWVDVQIHKLLAELREVNTTHMLYTDSSDVIALANSDEIMRKYIDDYRNPDVLMSVEHDGGLNAGGWMAKTYHAIDALQWLSDAAWGANTDAYESSQERWREAVEDGQIEVTRDDAAYIFHVTGRPYEVIRGRAWGTPLRTYNTPVLPCLLHYAGGYTDPHVGKAAQMERTWRELGYPATVNEDGSRC